MIRTFALISTFALVASGALAAPALDANGKCRDGGKFVEASKCKAPAASTTGKCRDKATKKFVKCGSPNSEPVPKAK